VTTCLGTVPGTGRKERQVRKGNVHDADFGEPRERDGFRARRGRIGYALGAERPGISLGKLPPGEAAYPYR
jgi:uncharacterized cupin superfamily protein